MTYDEAFTWCQGLDGHLPTPTSAQENEYLYGLGSTWLGFEATDPNLAYQNWNQHTNEPSGDGSKVHLVDRTPWNKDESWYGTWNDVDPTADYAKLSSTCYIDRPGI